VIANAGVLAHERLAKRTSCRIEFSILRGRRPGTADR
jgi:hypothetical protein